MTSISRQTTPDARTALVSLRRLVRSLPEPEWSQAREALAVIAPRLKAKPTGKGKGMENSEFFRGLSRMIRAVPGRVATGDPEDLAAAVALLRELRAAVDEGGRGMVATGDFKLAAIAEATGMAKQSAWERWGR